ncbi:Putative phosphoinositide phosphatase [Phaffia rhodozyma]|uniref:Putative phosphoinositide phosphatase n=1 Tax=Phaffia rhodozyma TaxID=264483 RepID=A0A0F7SMR9_PHARH|nr:Putative phosphoinositide phosphatase [Phaffia rhodozyma]
MPNTFLPSSSSSSSSLAEKAAVSHELDRTADPSSPATLDLPTSPFESSHADEDKTPTATYPSHPSFQPVNDAKISTDSLNNRTVSNTISEKPVEPSSYFTGTYPLGTGPEPPILPSSSPALDSTKEATGNMRETQFNQENGPPLSLNKFTLYETRSRFYILGTNQSDSRTRVLKIDRLSGTELNVVEDMAIYDARQTAELLRMIEEGNKGTGGMEKVMIFYGLVGFVKFTQGWYLILITKRSVVALVGGHYLYHCDETLMMSVAKGGHEKTAEETRLLSTFQKVDLSKNFYFSYTYDLTSSLQSNLTGVRASCPPRSANALADVTSFHKISHRYMWNYYLLRQAFGLDDGSQTHGSWKGPLGGDKKGSWILPIIHGFVDQAKLGILGRTVYITLIGRRSRFSAGARYWRRGADEWGDVANEVETEQIVSEPTTTPFHCPTPRFSNLSPQSVAIDSRIGNDTAPSIPLKHSNPNYTSYVQYRGSIPLLWSQDTSGSQFRPPIEINVVDPYFSAAARHFNQLLKTYGGRVIIVNLIKAKEAVPREMKLLAEFTQCIEYLNQFLPEDAKMIHIPFDMSRASKNKDQDVVGILEDIAEESLEITKFFHSGRMRREDGIVPFRDTLQLQSGILRTNCVDCLDRTNAAQFAMGKRVFGHQLYALGIIPSPILEYDCVATNLLNSMYHDQGDTLALQYSGGALVNRVDTYKHTTQWNSHSRDLIENIKRYYANSLLDAEKQSAIDAFLGVEKGISSPILRRIPKRGYRDWFDPNHLDHPVSLTEAENRIRLTLSQGSDFYVEYYRPRLFTVLDRHFAMRINTSSKNDVELRASPFRPKASKSLRSRRSIQSISSVRRWLASDGTYVPAQRQMSKLKNQLAIEPDDRSVHVGAEGDESSTDINSVEWKVQKSLQPVVEPNEIQEYVRWSASHEDELFSSHTLGRPIDLSLYRDTVSMSTAALVWSDENTDINTYRSFVSMDIYDNSHASVPFASFSDNNTTSQSNGALKPSIDKTTGNQSLPANVFSGGAGWVFGVKQVATENVVSRRNLGE